MACDDYRRWAQDLDFYSRLVDGPLARGLEPWPTLQHWDLPQDLQDEGDWSVRDTVSAFEEYTDVVTRVLGDCVQHWTTRDEPWCTTMHGHHDRTHTPGVRGARPGIVRSLHPITPASASTADAGAATRYDGLRNCWFLDPLYGRGTPADVWPLAGDDALPVLDGDLGPIAGRTDFLGVNDYFPEMVSDAAGRGPLGVRLTEAQNVERTASGWQVAPDGLAQLLERVARDYRPSDILITENGATYDDLEGADGTVHDLERQGFLVRHLEAQRAGIARGVPVRGYFARTPLDNFERAEGLSRRFGLVHVDFTTQRRQPKDSGRWYASFLDPATEARRGRTAHP